MIVILKINIQVQVNLPGLNFKSSESTCTEGQPKRRVPEGAIIC
jgi:hypothetical protein